MANLFGMLTIDFATARPLCFALMDPEQTLGY